MRRALKYFSAAAESWEGKICMVESGVVNVKGHIRGHYKYTGIWGEHFISGSDGV